jgi:hypothetical protein
LSVSTELTRVGKTVVEERANEIKAKRKKYIKVETNELLHGP